MQKFSLVMFVIIILSFGTSIYAADAGWERMIGSPDKNEEANSVIVTAKGNYIIGGSVRPSEHGGKDLMIMQVSPAGQIVWQKAYGGAFDDYGLMAQPAWDGGYVLVGEKNINGEDVAGIYLVKTDSKGDSIWTQTYEAEHYYITANAIRQTKDSGYVILGTTDYNSKGYYDVFLMKVNAKGNYEWDQNYGSGGNDFGNSVELTKDSGYLITGSTNSSANGIEMYVIKTDKDGDTLWTRIMGGKYTDIALSAKETDGGYIICGEINMMSTDLKSNAILIKLDKDGTTVWEKEYGGEANDGFQAILVTKDKGVIAAGYTNSYSKGGKDVYLVKTDSMGNELWYKTFGGTKTDYATSICQTKDAEFIIAGTYSLPGDNSTDVYLIKTDANGNIK